MAKVKHKITSAFLIGVFVIVGLAILVGTIIWLGASKFFEENQYYVTYFDGSIEGLEKGSSVKYLGVPVGSVTQVSVAPDGRLVEVEMQIGEKIKIDSNLRVKAEFAGIAGGKFLQLSYPTNPDILKMYPRIDFETPHTLIKSSPSGIEEIEIAMREVMNNLRLIETGKISNKTIRFLNGASSFFENDELYAIIENLSESTVKFNSILEKADTSKVISNVEQTSEKLLETSRDLELFADTLGKQFNQLELNKKFDRAFAQYDTTVIGTRRVIKALGYRTEEILFTLNETLRDLQATSKQLRKSLKAYTENPSQMLFSEPPPEEE